MPKIILTNEGVERISIPLKRATMLIGNDPGAEVHLDNEAISRNHASIIYENEQYIIHDNGSSNGTFVNGQKVMRQRLSQGDRISFGPYQFQVDLRGEDHAPEIVTHRPRYLNSKGSSHRSSVDLHLTKGSSDSDHIQVMMAGDPPVSREPKKSLIKISRRFGGLIALAVLSAILALGISGKFQGLVHFERTQTKAEQMRQTSSAPDSSAETENPSAQKQDPVMFVNSTVAGGTMVLGILGGLALLMLLLLSKILSYLRRLVSISNIDLSTSKGRMAAASQAPRPTLASHLFNLWYIVLMAGTASVVWILWHTPGTIEGFRSKYHITKRGNFLFR